MRPLPVGADDGDAARIVDLVRQSRDLEAAARYMEAARKLDAAAALLETAPQASTGDRAVVAWRRALLRFRASQATEMPACDWTAGGVLPLTQDAVALSAEIADPTLRGQVLQLRSAVSLAAGDFDAAMDAAGDSVAMLEAHAPCAAAASARLRVQAALLLRRPAAARAALDTAEALGVRGGCPPAMDVENRLLHARILIATGRFDAASARLTELRADPVAAATPRLRGSGLYNLSEIALMRGDYPAAEILNEEARAAFRDALRAGPVLAQIDHRAAIIRQELGDLPAARRFYDAALRGLDCRLGPTHPTTLAVRRERVRLIARQGEASAATAEARAVVRIADRAGLDPHTRALNHALLGLVLHETGAPRRAAERALRAGLSMLADVERSDLDRTPGLTALAEIALADGRLAEAQARARSAIDILSASASDTVQRLGRATRILAAVRAAAGDRADALRLGRENRDRILAQLRGAAQLATYTSDFAPAEIRAQTGQLAGHLWHLLQHSQDPALVDEFFRTLQVLHMAGGASGASGVADALLARYPALAAPVARERALLARVDGYERLLRSASDPDFAMVLRDDILDVRRQLDALRGALPDTPEMAAFRRLTTPRTVGLQTARRALDPGQALWLQASFDDVTYTVLLTRDGHRVARVPVPAQQLETQVQALRASVDLPAGVVPVAEDFPVAAAHGLYCALFGPHDPASGCAQPAQTIGTATLAPRAELFVLPDRAMQQMALGVLLARPLDAAPDFAALRDAAWLARRHPHQTAPTVTAFAERRRTLRPETRAARPLVAFAPYGPFRAGLCDADRQPVPDGDRRGSTGLVDPQRAFGQSRLPMTVELVRTVAAAAGSTPNRDWFECEAATEQAVKRQDLSSVDVLLFATHAEVGELPGDLPEPGLFMAAPRTATPADDGYLKASEIAQLDIGADLVVLSACSTGSDSGLPGAEGLSGLARAFFQAGASRLVVSHWDVAAVSSSALFQSLLAKRQAGGDAPLSVTLQQAMIAVMESPRAPVYAHPFVWAPFTAVVGR